MCGSDGSAAYPGCGYCRNEVDDQQARSAPVSASDPAPGAGNSGNVMIRVSREEDGDDEGGGKGPIVQHGCFVALALAMIAGFAWLCTSQYEFRRLTLRFIFSYPLVVGFILLPASVVHIVAFFGKKFRNDYGRDYTQNYLGWLVLIMALGFIAYGLTRAGG